MTSEVEHRLAAALADRYRIEREIGQGGMATVFLAEDLKLDRKVAIKVLRPDLAAVIGAQRFLKEIKTTAILQHPHILGLIDSGQSDGLLWYAMPFVEGESLRDRLQREKQLPIPDAVRLAKEVAGALDYAHRHGVIHRDIKPENILLHDASALVADFGIALAATSAGTRMTETGMSLGTPQYMSPEQAMGEREITARSDIYALGAVTYEMLTGEPPFSGATAQALVARVVTETPRPLIAQRHTIPLNVEAAVLTALEKLPADRFASARAFIEALDDRTFTGRGRTRTIAATGPGASMSRRTVFAALAFAVICLAAAIASRMLPRSASPVSRQRVTLWEHALAPMLEGGSSYDASQAAIAPDGSSIVFVDSVGGTLHLMRKVRGEAAATPMAGTGGALSPFFSPDGRWVGYRSADGKLRKVPVDGGGSVTLTENGDIQWTAAAWLDDGTIIYAVQGQWLGQINAGGGATRLLTPRGISAGRSILNIAPLPGSRGFLFTDCPGNPEIESAVRVFDFKTRSERTLLQHAVGAWYSAPGYILYTDRAGGLYAAGFDVDKLQLTTGPTPVIADVRPGAFAMSSTGTILYGTGPGGGTPSELMWVTRTGTAVSMDSTWHGDLQYPALSPDGTNLAVSVTDATTQLWIRHADGTRQKLTNEGVVNWRPAWTPDGKSVVFSANRVGGQSQDDFDLYQMSVDGSAPRHLVLHHTWGVWEAEYSRDGKWLVVRSDENGNEDSNIRARRLDGDTALVPILVDPSLTTEIAISPDGHWIAYAGDVTGRLEIYLSPFPDVTFRRLISRNGGIEPRWAHSGRELFYKSADTMMVVAITPGATLVAGSAKPLFPLRGYRMATNRQQYDVAPDDQHFVMIRDLPGNAGDLIYAENWFPKLLTKMKR